jgi:hypothetical protein
MRENRPSGSMSGEWKRSESHRATPRLYHPTNSGLAAQHRGMIRPAAFYGTDFRRSVRQVMTGMS